jgi:hypothetical protein
VQKKQEKALQRVKQTEEHVCKESAIVLLLTIGVVLLLVVEEKRHSDKPS